MDGSGKKGWGKGVTWLNLFLASFWFGALWSLATLLLGGLHGGHSHHTAHVSHGAVPKGGVSQAHGTGHNVNKMVDGWFGTLLSPSAAALFLTWFGAVGFLLVRHSTLGLAVALAVAFAVGMIGAWLVAAFIRYLQSHEQPLNPLDFQMVGLLGKVSSPIRRDGVGELIYLRNGARTPLPARSEDGLAIERGVEVIVTRFAKGIAYVRTWDAMTQEVAGNLLRPSSQEEKDHVG